MKPLSLAKLDSSPRGAFGMAIAANVSWDATVVVVGASVVLCWLVAAVTAISGIKYLWDNRSFINTAK